MARNLKLLLVENVESLGIVGDVVNVRTGFARNFLLPRNLATKPDDKLIAQLSVQESFVFLSDQPIKYFEIHHHLVQYFEYSVLLLLFLQG